MIRYCPLCGTGIEERQAFGRARPVCPACEYTHFDDPKVAVGVVAEFSGNLLLVKRAVEPKAGMWSFPAGFVDAGEIVEHAAAREVLEETGVEVSIDHLIGVYSSHGERTIFVAYAGTVLGGSLCVSKELLDIGYFAPHQLPELAFPHDSTIIARWQERRKAP